MTSAVWYKSGQSLRRGSGGLSNQLFFGDNLGVLRESIKDESVDLVYLDPPFNSSAIYNVLFAGPNGPLHGRRDSLLCAL